MRDRLQFGLKQLPVQVTNIVNNLLALTLIAIVTVTLGKETNLVHYLLSWKVIVFALTLQVTASCFSYAFRNMRVNQVILATKSSDFFIPFALLTVTSIWSWENSVFSFLTALICFPFLYKEKNKSSFPWLPSLAVCGSLIIQASVAPFTVDTGAFNQWEWLPYTTGLILWRFIFSLFIGRPDPIFIFRQLRKHADKQHIFPLFSRAALTIAAQGFLILSLSQNQQTLAWPILNSTGLVSLFFSGLIIKEKVSRNDYIIIGLTAFLATARTIVE